MCFPGQPQPVVMALLSGSKHNITDSQITENPSLKSNSLVGDVRLTNRELWCSQTLGLNIEDPYLDFNFGTEIIVLYYLNTTGTMDNHVTQIQVEIDPNGMGKFEFIQNQSTGAPQVSRR